MAYTYPDGNRLYSVPADVDAVATLLARRQSTAGTAPGITKGGADVDLTLDAANAWIRAIADATLCAVGFQAQSHAGVLGNASTAVSAWTDIGNGTTTGFPPYTFLAPMAKTYLVHVDLSVFMSVNGWIYFRLLSNGTPYDVSTWQFHPGVNQAQRLSFRIPVPMTAGANILKVQWFAYSPHVGNVEAGYSRTFTITG